ncbi:exosome complex exonuclease RRP46 homolog [Durio zibethinus]|uniref:Exosome complex exonuclease RRP46 homolog n=1 Tax=Durio zibethinus TaxID=66656 RepID=A0A6P5XLT2_DURZI|nr:exosome complex exonuclease RRP46 homolog [Durio zibethinus]
MITERERAMEVDREDGRTQNQLRPLACSRNILHRAHGSASWSQGDTEVFAAVYGRKAGTRKNENPEKAWIEVIWKPKTGQIGKLEKEYEMILKGTLQSICILTVNPNSTTSIIIQVVNDDGAVLPSAINAACVALVDAGIPMKHLAVAICCCAPKSGYVILDPTKLEEQKIKAFAYLVFPNSVHSVLPEGSLMDDYFYCLERGCAESVKLSDFLRSLKQHPTDSSKAG